MNNTERDAAIDDLLRRVTALEGKDQQEAPTEETDVRNEEGSESGQQG